MDAPDAVPLPAGKGHVAFRDVCFAYPDGRSGLNGLSFEAAPGTTVALVGPSGAGKSTALALIPRLQDVSAGAVLVDGADVRAVTLASLRDAIAYVGQDTLLFDDTVEANIGMGRPGADRADVERAAEAAAAAGFIAACRRDTRRGSARAGSASRAASGSGLRSRARCCAIPASCCWTRPPARSTPRARRRCRRPSRGCAGPHHDRGRPPALDRARCGSRRGHGRRRGCRARYPRRAAGPGRPLRPPRAQPGARAVERT